MPPYAMWLRGPGEIRRWMLGAGSAAVARGCWPTEANGCAAFGQYRPDGEGGHRPWAIQVIEISGDGISGLHAFLDPTLFAAFGLPATIPPVVDNRGQDVGEAGEVEQLG